MQLGPKFVVSVVLVVLLGSPNDARSQENDVRFARGHIGGNTDINIHDAARILDFLFRGAENSIGCLDAADVDGYRESAVAFVIDRSSSAMSHADLPIVKQAIVSNLNALSPEMEFGIVFFDTSILQFPASGRPLKATPENVAAATAWVNSVPGGSGTCLGQAMVAGLSMIQQSEASDRVLFYSGDGAGTCNGQREDDHQRQTLEFVARENVSDTTIHAIGVTDMSESRELFLQRITSQHGGRFVCCDCSSQCP